MRPTMRCVGGPYAGRHITCPRPRYRINRDGHWVGPIPFLVNIWSGSALHCYLTVSNGYWKDWRLEYQEEF